MPASYLPLQEVLVDQAVPRTYKEAMASDQATLWMDACKVEHDALVRNNVYEWAELPVMVGNDKNNPCYGDTSNILILNCIKIIDTYNTS